MALLTYVILWTYIYIYIYIVMFLEFSFKWPIFNLLYIIFNLFGLFI